MGINTANMTTLEELAYLARDRRHEASAIGALAHYQQVYTDACELAPFCDYVAACRINRALDRQLESAMFAAGDALQAFLYEDNHTLRLMREYKIRPLNAYTLVKLVIARYEQQEQLSHE